ncbi:MAG: GNAT family N-acetyltransferase [Acidobacteriota bacterium]
MTIEARWVSSLDELRALGPRYDEMVLASGDGGVFYQREWLERVWPYYEATVGGTLAFLIVLAGGEPVALAPLVIRAQGWTHARQRTLAFIGGTWDELDNWMPGLMFASSDPREQADTTAVLADAIARRGWDLLELRLMRPSPSLDALRTHLPGLLISTDRLQTPRARVDGGLARYWASRSKRLTRILDRGRTRAAADGVSLRHEVTPDVPLAHRDEIETLHLARQDRLRTTGRMRSSPFEHPQARRVFWSLVDWASGRGQLRTHWLRIGERTAAYVIALHHAGTTFTYFNAIDPAAERYHPGSLILAELIEREVRDYGASVIDLMAGANLTKTLLATEAVTLSNLSLVNPDRPAARAKDAWIRLARRLALSARGR